LRCILSSFDVREVRLIPQDLRRLLEQSGNPAISGKLELFTLSSHFDFFEKYGLSLKELMILIGFISEKWSQGLSELKNIE